MPFTLALAFVLTSFAQQLPDASTLLKQPTQVLQISREGDLSGTNAPVFDVKALDGAAYGLSSLKGKTVLLEFWASWCAPCREAMPALQTMNLDFKDHGLVILGIDAGE